MWVLRIRVVVRMGPRYTRVKHPGGRGHGAGARMAGKVCQVLRGRQSMTHARQEPGPSSPSSRTSPPTYLQQREWRRQTCV